MPMNPRLLRPITSGDPDARRYIAAVQAADGNTLEPAVRKAITDFVVGCKQDGIWGAIKASCILAGARTLAGALTPLVGAAPTNNGPFVSGDYDRKLGLVGNGSSKYLNSNRNNNADPQDSKHLAIYKTQDTTMLGSLIGVNTAAANGSSWLFDSVAVNNDTVRINQNPSTLSLQFPATGFVGASRSSSSTVSLQRDGSSSVLSSTSQTPLNESVWVFAGAGSQFVNTRLAYYSIGENLNLALLDSRVSVLITAIGNAIP